MLFTTTELIFSKKYLIKYLKIIIIYLFVSFFYKIVVNISIPYFIYAFHNNVVYIISAYIYINLLEILII